MKRRDFIMRTSLIGIGGLLMPKLFVGQKIIGYNSSVVQIPIGREHVRHGLLQPKTVENMGLPNWLNIYERQIFFANGHTSSTDDLESLTFEVDGVVITILKKGDKTFYVSNSDQPTDLKHSTQTIISSGKRQTHYHKLFAGCPSLKTDALIVISGRVNASHQSLGKGTAMVSEDDIIVTATEMESEVIAISKG